jgi:hypothetical protein
MIYDTDGNLLIGVSPDHNLNGAIFKYDFDTEDLDMLISNIGSPTGLGLIPNGTSEVIGRHIFYNQSAYDGNNAGIQTTVAGANNDDNDAIDTSKAALLPGVAATWNNITGYEGHQRHHDRSGGRRRSLRVDAGQCRQQLHLQSGQQQLARQLEFGSGAQRTVGHSRRRRQR